MNAVTTVAETVKCAALQLRPHSESPRLDAELLLGKVLKASRASLTARADESLSGGAELELADLIARRAHGVPVAYLTGSREFWSLPLNVTCLHFSTTAWSRRTGSEVSTAMAINRFPPPSAWPSPVIFLAATTTSSPSPETRPSPTASPTKR